MKKTSLIIFLLLVLTTSNSQTFEQKIPEKAFLNNTRLLIKDYPTADLPKETETLYLTVYNNSDEVAHGSVITIHGKYSYGYKLLDSLEVSFIYNPAKDPRALYKNGQIHVISGMPMNESEAIAKFKFINNKLSFIETDIFDPNADLEIDIEEALKAGKIKEASELYLGVQSPPWGYLESAQMTLLKRAHEVAMEFSKKKDYKMAAETMGYAYDFYTGITEASDIKADSEEAKYLADYTYFLLNNKDYKKCIEVCKVTIKLSPALAGPYLHLGNSLFATDKKEEAQKPYEKFIEIRKSKKEESRIPAYVYERLTTGSESKDSPEVIVYKFIKWYFDNKINEIELTNWNDPAMKFYRVNFTATENYLKKIQATNFVSKSYIDTWRAYFKKRDEAFLKEKQNDGPPMGFEYDFITNSQEKPEKVVLTDFKRIEFNATKAKVKYAGYLVYLLRMEEGRWKITGIENNEN